MSYRYLVLGAGMQGRAAAFALCAQNDTQSVSFADRNSKAADDATKHLANFYPSKTKNSQIIDARSHQDLVKTFKEFDGVFSATSYEFNLAITRAAIEAKTNLIDLGGNTDVVFEQLALHEQAMSAGCRIIPDCGLAPGLGNTLAAISLAQNPSIDEIAIYCGGLPQHPKPPLNYQLVFSVRGLTNEYFGEAVVIRNGKRTKVATFEECEPVEFAKPIGACEAFTTSGGSSTCPWTFESKLKSYDYKTVRYPGHYEKMKCMKDLGLLELEPIEVDGQNVVPREVFHVLAERTLSSPIKDDLVVLRVVSKSKSKTVCTYELIDFADTKTNLSAMERSTAFPAALSLVYATRKQTPIGIVPLERAITSATYIDDLAGLGLKLTKTG